MGREGGEQAQQAVPADRVEDGSAANDGRRLRSICVFCGSSPGRSPEYLEQAARLGREMAARGITLVYGGGGIGLMGQVSKAAHEAGGKVIGIIPEALKPVEVSREGFGEQITVKSMHERKGLMSSKADAFIALPGGVGTLEETIEMTTWLQLGIHRKPIGVLNTLGFYTKLLDFISHAADEGFIRDSHRDILLSAGDPIELLDLLESFAPPTGLVGAEAWAGSCTSSMAVRDLSADES